MSHSGSVSVPSQRQSRNYLQTLIRKDRPAGSHSAGWLHFSCFLQPGHILPDELALSSRGPLEEKDHPRCLVSKQLYLARIAHSTTRLVFIGALGNKRIYN